MPEPLVPLISLNDHPIRDAALWPVVSPAYSSSSAYPVDSHVVYNNQLYRCIYPIGASGEPWTAAHWTFTTVDEELRRGLDNGMDALHVVASEYSPSNTYFVGNYVMKDGSFYRCTTAIQNGEAWTPAHWMEVTVSSELVDHRIDLDATRRAITPEYDENQAYTKNDYVIREGKLYRALQDTAALEPWSLDDWEECTVGSELGDSRAKDKLAQDSLAPEYSTNTTYLAGSLVMYDGRLYKCIQTVAVPEPFNGEKWSRTSISNEISMSDIVSVLGFYIDSEGYLCQNITSDGMDPSTVNLDEVLGFYISEDGYISQRVSG